MKLEEVIENEVIQVDEGNFVLFKIAIKVEDADNFLKGLAELEKSCPEHLIDNETGEPLVLTDKTLARRRALRLIMEEANRGVLMIGTAEEQKALEEAKENIANVELI
jgi:hypothetical protein